MKISAFAVIAICVLGSNAFAEESLAPVGTLKLGTVAPTKVVAYNNANGEAIHSTHIKMSHHDYLFTDAFLYQGVFEKGLCKHLKYKGENHSYLSDGVKITAPAILFTDPITSKSCAAESLTTSENKTFEIIYRLVNKGQDVVLISEPAHQKVVLD